MHVAFFKQILPALKTITFSSIVLVYSFYVWEGWWTLYWIFAWCEHYLYCSELTFVVKEIDERANNLALADDFLTCFYLKPDFWQLSLYFLDLYQNVTGIRLDEFPLNAYSAALSQPGVFERTGPVTFVDDLLTKLNLRVMLDEVTLHKFFLRTMVSSFFDFDLLFSEILLSVADIVTAFLDFKLFLIDFFSPYFVFTIMFFFFTNIIITASKEYLSVPGAVRLYVVSLFVLLVVATINCYAVITEGCIFFCEIKIYSLYVPTVNSSFFFSIDYISCAFFELVLFIAIGSVLYSYVYLVNDPFILDFLTKLMWFVISMLMLVIVKNFILFYFAWEFIGITSMWLINFNSQRLDTFKSALKAFVFNKISDLCLVSALILGYLKFNTPCIESWNILHSSGTGFDFEHENTILTTGCLLITAAMIKSAQIGFHIWLPDSMDAPVPASALIHSATLVSAGVYLLLRFENIFYSCNLSFFILSIGAFTGAYGGVVAALQTDLKKALAYSTISHCGFLFVAVGMGSAHTAIIYLFLHGFFKALSFICAGEAIRLYSGYQDSNRMGSLFFMAPGLCAQFFIAMSNLCAFPFFFGYIYKNSLQNLLIAHASFGNLIQSLCIVGFLSSLFYFNKVFYTVCFSFSKNTYKSQYLIFKKALLNFSFPQRTPIILFIIFWILYAGATLCVCNIFYESDKVSLFSEVLTPNYQFQLYKKLTPNRAIESEYFFFFYTMFLGIVCFINFNTSIRRFNTSFSLIKLFFFIFFVLSAGLVLNNLFFFNLSLCTM